MQLMKYRGDTHTIIGCKQKEGESSNDHFDRFTKATLDTLEQDNSMVTGAFICGLLPCELSKKKSWG